MMGKIPFLLSVLLIQLFCLSIANAVIFERRKVIEAEFSWFIYPVAGEIPGVQKFSGAGVTLAAVASPETDITYVRLTGSGNENYNEANDPDLLNDGDFRIDLLTVFDIPLWTPHLTFSYVYSDIINAAYPEGERGIHSDPESKTILLGKKVRSEGGEISVNFFDNQIELYYSWLNLEVEPYGLVTPRGKFYNARQAQLNQRPQGHRYGIYWDDTDNRRDPRLGYRIQWEQYRIPESRADAPSYFQTDRNLTIFIPFAERSQVLVLNDFYGTSQLDKAGDVKRERYCDPGSACPEELENFFEQQKEEAKKSRATPLGGTSRLRGYPTNRFYDSFMAFRGIEYRWYVSEANFPYNFFISKGTYTGLQLAFFYERGTVAPTESQLWDQWKDASGFGIRLLLSTVVIRLDRGFSDEGGETTIFIGYPF